MSRYGYRRYRLRYLAMQAIIVIGIVGVVLVAMSDAFNGTGGPPSGITIDLASNYSPVPPNTTGINGVVAW